MFENRNHCGLSVRMEVTIERRVEVQPQKIVKTSSGGLRPFLSRHTNQPEAWCGGAGDARWGHSQPVIVDGYGDAELNRWKKFDMATGTAGWLSGSVERTRTAMDNGTYFTPLPVV
jgi:hypothetical protein